MHRSNKVTVEGFDVTIVNKHLNSRKYNITNTIPLNVHRSPEQTVVPSLTQNKQMPHPTFIFKQNRQNTQHHYVPFAKQNHTLIQMHKNKHISQEFVDCPYGGIRSLLAEWKRDDQSASGSGCRLNEGITISRRALCPVAVTDLGDANLRFLGLVSVGQHDH